MELNPISANHERNQLHPTSWPTTVIDIVTKEATRFAAISCKNPQY
jgi:hypothetical protein